MPSMKNIQMIKSAVEIHPERIILLSGNGQNVGKTSFACRLIEHLKKQNKKVYSIKISPHFHNEYIPHRIYSDERFMVSMEKNPDTGKDSSRLLLAGADESFYLQVRDDSLLEAVEYAFSMIPHDIFVVIESGALRKWIKPALFLFLMRDKNDPIKASAANFPAIADRIVIFNGEGFDLNIDNIKIVNEQLILID